MLVLYLETLGIARAAVPIEVDEGGERVKLLSWAICSLGIWVVLNSFLGPVSIWEDIVFGAITAILAAVAAFSIKD